MTFFDYTGSNFRSITFAFLFFGIWGVIIGAISHLGYGPLEQNAGIGFAGMFGAIGLGIGFALLKTRCDAFSLKEAQK